MLNSENLVECIQQISYWNNWRWFDNSGSRNCLESRSLLFAVVFHKNGRELRNRLRRVLFIYVYVFFFSFSPKEHFPLSHGCARSRGKGVQVKTRRKSYCCNLGTICNSILFEMPWGRCSIRNRTLMSFFFAQIIISAIKLWYFDWLRWPVYTIITTPERVGALNRYIMIYKSFT